MRLYIVALGIVASLGTFLFGYDTNTVTTSIAHASFKNYMHNPNAAWTGAIVATYIAGQAIGALIQSAVGDLLGRKRFMGMMCLLVILGTVIQTAAQNFGMFLAGRILTGIAAGALIGTVLMYNAEISPPEIRGFIGGLPGLMIVTGGFTANWVGYLCGYASYGQFQWRFPLALQIPPAVILLISLFAFLPESPRWLIRKNQDDRAYCMFVKIMGLPSTETRREFDDMREQVLYEQRHEVKSLKEAWTRYRMRVFVAIVVQAMTSLTGVNVIAFYQTTLYQAFGIDGQTVLLMSAIYGTVGFIANIISVRYLDKVGRVTMLKISLPAIVVILIYCAVMGRFFNTGNDMVGKAFSILGLYLFTLAYYLGVNSTTWLYGVEVLPVSLRGIVTGWAAAAHFIFNIGVNEAGPTAFANIHENYYYVFAASTTIFALFVYLYFPETKGRSLEAIAESFGDKIVSADEVKSEVPVDTEKRKDEQIELVHSG